MDLKRLLSVLVAALMIALILAGCGGGGKTSITGKWLPEGGGKAPSGFPDDMEFFSDGTIVFEDMSGTYTADSGRLVITLLWEAMTFDFEIKGNTLALKQGGIAVAYEREQATNRSNQPTERKNDKKDSPKAAKLDLPLIKYDNVLTRFGGTDYNNVYALYVSPTNELVNYEYIHGWNPTEEFHVIENNVRSVIRGGAPVVMFILKNDDTLWGKGSNLNGILGDNTGVDRDEFVQILDNVATVYYYNSPNGSVFAIKNDLSLWGWGPNNVYQLGTGDTENRYTPTKIMDNVVKVYSSGSYTFALQKDGSLYVWGTYKLSASAYDAQPRKILDGVKNVFPLEGNNLGNDLLANGNHVFITGDNKAYTWSKPETMQQLENPPTPYMPDWDITSIVITSLSRDNNQFFITADGTLWGMGDNAYGELCDGTKIKRNEPVEIMKDVSAIIPTNYVVPSQSVIKKDGSLWNWISNETYVPQKILDDVVNYTGEFFITANGSVYLGSGKEAAKLFDETVAIPEYLILSQ